MPAWFDIMSLGDDPNREPIEDIEESALFIEKLIQKELDAGIPSNRIVLIGFSQGGAMALHTALRYPLPLLGAVVMSGYLLKPSLLKLQESKNIKIMG